MKHNKNTAYMYLLLTFSLWGSLYVVSRFVLNRLPVFTTAFFRYLIAFITLSFMLHGKKLHWPAAGDRKYIFMLGFFGYTVSVGAQLVGTKLAGASMASLINSLNPAAITVAAAFMLGEKLSFHRILGILLSLGGVCITVGPGGSAHPAGIAFSLFSVLTWSIISVMVRRVTRKYDALTVTWLAMGIAMVCNLPAGTGQILASKGTFSPDVPCVLGLFYMGIFCTGISYILWNKSLSMLEAGTCSAFYPIQPLTSLLLGCVFMGETITPVYAAGAFLIIFGVLVSLLHFPTKKVQQV